MTGVLVVKLLAAGVVTAADAQRVQAALSEERALGEALHDAATYLRLSHAQIAAIPPRLRQQYGQGLRDAGLRVERVRDGVVYFTRGRKDRVIVEEKAS
jgi:hypothetical protein